MKNVLMRTNMFNMIVIVSHSKAAMKIASCPTGFRAVQCNRIISSLHNDGKVIALQ